MSSSLFSSCLGIIFNAVEELRNMGYILGFAKAEYMIY
jgi:hypothetical protein